MFQLKNKMKFFFFWRYVHTQDIKNLLFSLSRFAYFGAIASLLHSLFDLHEAYKIFQNIHIYKNDIKIKTALFRFAINCFLGLESFFPYFIFFGWVLAYPFILPLFSVSIVAANLFQAYRTYKIMQYELSVDIAVSKNKPHDESENILNDTQMKVYTAQKELAINSILTFGAIVSMFGVFFPPLLMVGMGIAFTGSALRILDNQFLFGLKIKKIFQQNTDMSHNGDNTFINNKIKNSHYSIIKKANFHYLHSANNDISQLTPFHRKKEVMDPVFATIKKCRQALNENTKMQEGNFLRKRS